MYERSRVNVEVEPIVFTSVKFTCVRTEKLHYSGNPPLHGKIRGRLSAEHIWNEFRWQQTSFMERFSISSTKVANRVPKRACGENWRKARCSNQLEQGHLTTECFQIAVWRHGGHVGGQEQKHLSSGSMRHRQVDPTCLPGSEYVPWLACFTSLQRSVVSYLANYREKKVKKKPGVTGESGRWKRGKKEKERGRKIKRNSRNWNPLLLTQ